MADIITAAPPLVLPSFSPFLSHLHFYQGLHTLVDGVFLDVIYKFRMFRPRVSKCLFLIPTTNFRFFTLCAGRVRL